PDDRVRQIHFANLPPRCTIRIYTLDGDLVREIEHDMDPSDPNASHDTWNMITRNTQLVVSGLYYWTVEEPDGETQIGKLVIIM
ncbi:MAG: T9SS C-terminal target domain-containing protein, partial [Candidatus Zixiibacteriota bacterium]